MEPKLFAFFAKQGLFVAKISQNQVTNPYVQIGIALITKEEYFLRKSRFSRRSSGCSFEKKTIMNTPLTQNSEIKTVLNTTGFHLVKNLGDHAPEQLEKVIHGAVEEDLNYGGTSPRLRKSGKVFTSSEIKNFFPLPVHCEMSFLPNPPKTMYFYCKEQSEQGGETPLVDFRAVYNSLDPSFKEN